MTKLAGKYPLPKMKDSRRKKLAAVFHVSSI
jgi:hypothetical protein